MERDQPVRPSERSYGYRATGFWETQPFDIIGAGPQTESERLTMAPQCSVVRDESGVQAGAPVPRMLRTPACDGG